MTRCRRTSPPRLAALALLLLLVCFSVLHRGAVAARPLPASLVYHEDSVNDAADGLALQDGAAGNGGDELSVSEVMEAEQEADACEKGDDDECMQRRLLRDAHLDYIYTQHNGKP